LSQPHGTRPADWAHFRTAEGGFLFDRQALAEAYLVATGSEPHAPDLVEHAARAIETRAEDSRPEIARLLVPVLDAGLERCPHGRPLGVDLALTESHEPVPGFVVAPERFLAGPAMGSGRWPWTRAVLRALGDLLRPGDRVADVGTGTGILALYALHRGAASVDAVDIDPIAVAVARRNARRAGVADRLRISLGSTERLSDGYDVVVASLQALWELPPVLADALGRVRPGGWLIASPCEGMGELVQLEAALADLGLSADRTAEVEGWCAVAARRG
jgi:ribosomal protein L11 methylase PrmA